MIQKVAIVVHSVCLQNHSILQRNKFRPLHLILTPLVRELTDEEKMCDNPHPLQEVYNVRSKTVNIT